ncbi:hypothetical protein INR49_023692, partial [Caranx melampygus]
MSRRKREISAYLQPAELNLPAKPALSVEVCADPAGYRMPGAPLHCVFAVRVALCATTGDGIQSTAVPLWQSNSPHKLELQDNSSLHPLTPTPAIIISGNLMIILVWQRQDSVPTDFGTESLNSWLYSSDECQDASDSEASTSNTHLCTHLKRVTTVLLGGMEGLSEVWKSPSDESGVLAEEESQFLLCSSIRSFCSPGTMDSSGVMVLKLSQELWSSG